MNHESVISNHKSIAHSALRRLPSILLRVAVLVVRELAGSDFFAVAVNRLADDVPDLGIAPDEAELLIREADDVMQDQDLAVALRPGADADGRDRNGMGQPPGEIPGNLLEHDSEAPCSLQSFRIGQQLL